MRRVALDQADLVWRLAFGDGMTREESTEFVRYGWLPDSDSGDVTIPYDPNVLIELNKNMMAG